MKTWIILSITAALSQGYSVRTPADTFPIVSNVFPFKNLEILTNNLEQKETQEEEFVVDNLKSLVSLDDQDENTDDDEDVVESGSRARTLIGTISLTNHHQRHNSHGQHHRQVHHHHQQQEQHHHQQQQQREVHHQQQQQDDVAAFKTNITELAEKGEATADGRVCVEKVMMVEETQWQDVMTCDHKYKERCHESFITVYEPHQEEECDENFKKVCDISYEEQALNDVVEECRTPLVSVCEYDDDCETECRTVQETVCTTSQEEHEVEDDVVNCETVVEKKCEIVTEGFLDREECDEWPVEKCSVEKKTVKKFTPRTNCDKVPREMCAPKCCSIQPGDVLCEKKVKAVVVNNPVEQCFMEPQKYCKQVTKLLPALKSVSECVDVPQEVCAMSKINPKRVQRPTIQKWCFTPDTPLPTPPPECSLDRDCPRGEICQEEKCAVGCRLDVDCSGGYECTNNECVRLPTTVGAKLLNGFYIYGLGATDNAEVDVTLHGQETLEENSCSFSFEFDGSDSLSRLSFDTKQGLGGLHPGCWEAPLNAIIRPSTFGDDKESSMRLRSDSASFQARDEASICAMWDDGGRDETPATVCNLSVSEQSVSFGQCRPFKVDGVAQQECPQQSLFLF